MIERRFQPLNCLSQMRVAEQENTFYSKRTHSIVNKHVKSDALGPDGAGEGDRGRASCQ